MGRSIARFYILCLLIFPSLAGANVSELHRLFSQGFDALYERNLCGQNTLRLVDSAKQQGIDLKGANIIRLFNRDGTELDQVSAFQAREGGGLIPEMAEIYVTRTPLGIRYKKRVPQGVRLRYVGIERWMFHAFLEYRGCIFDFDFTNQPTVVPTAGYVSANLFPPSEGYFNQHRDELSMFAPKKYDDFFEFVRNDYLLEITPLESDGTPGPTMKMDLREYLRQLSLEPNTAGCPDAIPVL